MFRASKPSVSRTKHEKGNTPPAPQSTSKIPPAIVRDPTPPVKDVHVFPVPVHESQPSTEPSSVGQALKPDPALPAPKEVTKHNVQRQEQALVCRPFLAEIEDEGENLFREVREDRKIEMGNDPLIAQILDMFPEGCGAE